MSSEKLATLRLRHDSLAAIRAFFAQRGYLEVDTPLVTRSPGLEPHIDPLTVSLRSAIDGAPEPRWLITSAEIAMKKLLAHGAERIFQLSHVFRDGEHTARHRPEFTMLEWYRARCTLDELVDETADLVRAVAGAIGNASAVDVAAPFERVTCAEAFSTHANVDLRAALERMQDGDALALVRAVEGAGMKLRPGADFEDAFFHVMLERVEPQIGRARPTIVHRWPAQLAALARTSDDALFCERFEIYAGGLELCNAYDELTDADEQRARFRADNAKRASLGKPALPIDEELLALLPRVPRTCGNALGVDRLLMLLTGTRDIGAVTLDG